ncbi:glutathione reductase [filamentous cyanobacterium CCP5]|nr:glutathione reductase [filamentous cyanobacterium CCP5]
MAIPVPARPSGYRLGSRDASLQLEVFLDLECPFSKKAWPTMLALMNQSDGLTMGITAHPYVLCDHRQSWDVTKALVAIAGDDPLRGWRLIGHFYQHQQAFNSDACDGKTRQDLFGSIEDMAVKFDPDLANADLIKQIRADSGPIANRAKASIRYGIDRGVWSTPTFLVNGSEVPGMESSATLKDWQDFFASL